MKKLRYLKEFQQSDSDHIKQAFAEEVVSATIESVFDREDEIKDIFNEISDEVDNSILRKGVIELSTLNGGGRFDMMQNTFCFIKDFSINKVMWNNIKCHPCWIITSVVDEINTVFTSDDYAFTDGVGNLNNTSRLIESTKNAINRIKGINLQFLYSLQGSTAYILIYDENLPLKSYNKGTDKYSDYLRQGNFIKKHYD